MVLLTAKIKINPSKKQEKLLWDLSNTCRLLYNQALAERKYLYEAYQHSVSYTAQQNALPQLKQSYPRYRVVYSKVLQMTLKKLDSAFKAFYGLRKNGDTTAKLPSFRGSEYFFTLCYNQSGFKLTDHTIQLAHKHRNQTQLVFSVPFDFTRHQVKQIELFFDRYANQFYVTVTYNHPEPVFEDNGLYQAFDLGTVKHTAVNLKGKFLESTVKRADKYWEAKFQSLQKRKAHCKTGSRRERLFRQRLLSLKRRCKNQTKDWQHKQSKNFVQNTKANTLIVGELSPKQMTRTGRRQGKKQSYQKSINRGVHNTGHLSRFIELLTYKAKLQGKRVITIDERNTSKTCAVCGHQKEEMPLCERLYQCEVCEFVRDRDQNAAINIMKRFLSQNALWTGYQSFHECIANLRYTVNGKMNVSRLPSGVTGSANS